MEGGQIINLEDLEGLTPEEIIKLIDSGWPWPLDSVQEWFEELWNGILEHFYLVVDWVEARLKPLFDAIYYWIAASVDRVYYWIAASVDRVYYWIAASVDRVYNWIAASVDRVYNWIAASVDRVYYWIAASVDRVYNWITTSASWIWANIQSGLAELGQSIQSIASTVVAKVSEINQWFSNEFIDPFIDWLLQFPDQLIKATADYFKMLWDEFLIEIKNPKSPLWIVIYSTIGVMVIAIIAMSTPIGAAVIGAVRWGGATIAALWPAIGGWLAGFFGDLGIWIGLYAEAFLGWFAGIAGTFAVWFMGHLGGILLGGGVLALEATGVLPQIIDKLITPAITHVFDWFEAQGPISPMAGGEVGVGIGKLASFTVSGLAAMTLAGEFLMPLKHLGLGHIAAMVYDLINYKTLTAAFMGVLAFVYIKTPLTYYYNKMARPNIPDERGLRDLAGNYQLTQDEYVSWMQYHGYTDDWSTKLFDTVYRPLTPYLLRSLAEAGLLPEDVLDRELHHAGYREEVIPIIKQMMRNLAAGSLAAVSSSTAMTRYQEGFDDELTLRNNLSALGISDLMLDRYVFAAQLKYLYDYQSSLVAYHIDSYHRREIEAPELRRSLVSDGLLPERLELVVAAQGIKRLAAAKAADDPAAAVQFDTIRDRRKKLLITRDEEITQLAALGKELSYATAIADNDDVSLATKAEVITPRILLAYETDEGKINVDTIRRLARQQQISPDEEQKALEALEMPEGMATAIVANDALRLKVKTV